MSLNCVYCQKLVFGTQGVTVPNKGPAHEGCYQANQVLKRCFLGVNIDELNDSQLNDLQDLVLAEVNDRQRRASGQGGSDEIELF